MALQNKSKTIPVANAAKGANSYEEERKAKGSMDSKMNKASKKRFGFSVGFDQYKTSNFIKILCITLAIIIIPLEIFVQHVLQDNESDLILRI